MPRNRQSCCDKSVGPPRMIALPEMAAHVRLRVIVIDRSYRLASSIHVSSAASATTETNTATTIRLFVDITVALAYR